MAILPLQALLHFSNVLPLAYMLSCKAWTLQADGSHEKYTSP